MKETLEEIIKPKDIQRIISSTDAQTASIEIVELFAKWQAERMYSEVDLVKFVSFVGKNYMKVKGFYYMKGDFEKKSKVSIHQILEQFKKR